MSQPEPQIPQQPLYTQNLSCEASHGDQQNGAEKQLDKKALLGRFFAPDDGCQVNGRRHPGGGNPEYHQLQMPGFGPVVRYEFGHKG